MLSDNIIKPLCSLVFSVISVLNCYCQSKEKENSVSEAGPGIIEKLNLPPENLDSTTGVYIMENGGKSLLARLWLGQYAEKTIDIQLYNFVKDVTGLIAADFMLKAADRGVKIRLLLDDAATRMYSHELRLFDSHENIEVRVYNAGFRHGKPHRRIRKFAKNSIRLQNRMHNKAFIFDNQIGIIGGRNAADEYFDYHKKFNFRDRDVLLIGKVTEKINESFNNFWNDSLTVPYAELSGKKGKKLAENPDRFNELHIEAEGSKNFLQQTRQKIADFPFELDSAVERGDFIWVKQVNYISDKPGKNAQLKNEGPTICTDSIIAIMNKAKQSIIIQNPYFIFTDTMRDCLKELTGRGIKVTLITNSAASIDNHKAFSGYKRDRKEILKMGIAIYEFKPDAKLRYKLMLPDKQSQYNYKGDYGYHSKTVIIDTSISIIGSYNFDPRAHFYNTECFAVFRSEKVSEILLKMAKEEMLPENSWRVTLESNPDKHASLKKKLNVMIGMMIPRKWL